MLLLEYVIVMTLPRGASDYLAEVSRPFGVDFVSNLSITPSHLLVLMVSFSLSGCIHHRWSSQTHLIIYIVFLQFGQPTNVHGKKAVKLPRLPHGM